MLTGRLTSSLFMLLQLMFCISRLQDSGVPLVIKGILTRQWNCYFAIGQIARETAQLF